jgi:hypothetical protein
MISGRYARIRIQGQAMVSERAAHLAIRFADINQELDAFAEQCSADEWRRVTAAEQWPVGVVLRHIARSFAVYPSFIERVVRGQPMPALYNWEDIHRSNAEQAKEWADSPKEETLALLRQHGDELANCVRLLSDEQLDRTAISPLTGEALSTEAFAEGMLAHARIHLAGAGATVSGR